MRLLPEEEQEAVYDALYQGLINAESFAFKGMQRTDIATLGGELEGLYGAVAANYLQGIVDARLRLQWSGEGEMPVGALDMGGSSTQIVFLPDHHNEDASETCPNSHQQDETCQSTPLTTSTTTSHLNRDQFFSTSYLSYGVDQFRERLWTTLVFESQSQLNGAGDPETCASKFIQNPCANKGYEVEWEGFTLIGSGDTEECIRQTQRLIPHPEIPNDNHADVENQVGGIEHPPVRGKFLAMSLYFFSLDSLRVFSGPNSEAHRSLNLSWPNPSIEELHNALDGLCSRSWHGDMELQQETHSFTRPEVLPHRCIETVYMVTLLKDGFGFHPSSRDITFTFLVDGSEVEWTLGMALSMNAEQTALGNAREQQSQKSNATFEANCVDEPLTIQTETMSYALFGAESYGTILKEFDRPCEDAAVTYRAVLS
jgi:Golgi nucleoside diphosphatase